MKVTQKKLVVPIDLIRYCTQNKLVDELQLLLFLKFCSSGKIPYYKSYESEILSSLKIRKKDTLRSRLKQLESLNFLGYDVRNDVLHLRSFKVILNGIGGKMKFVKSTFLEIDHIKIFGPWIYASLIGEELVRQRWRRKTVDHYNGNRSTQSRLFSPCLHLGLSNELISKILFVSPSQASRLKNEASKAGLLWVKKKYEFVSPDPKDLTPFKVAYPEFRNRTKIVNGMVAVQSYDEMEPILRFKKRRFLLKPTRINHLPNHATIINGGIT